MCSRTCHQHLSWRNSDYGVDVVLDDVDVVCFDVDVVLDDLDVV